MRREIAGMGILLHLLTSHCLFGQSADTALALTPYQRQSLIDYCEQYGDVLSVSELSNVDGFTADEAKWLWESVKSTEGSTEKHRTHSLTAKFRKKYAADGFSIASKYAYSGIKLDAGLTVDNDPMEKFPDFASGYVKYRNIIAGDYSARFGQGLVLWKAFSMNTMGEPSTLMHKQSGFAGYRSTDESNFLRGACALIPVGSKWELSVLGSYKKENLNAVDSGNVHGYAAGANLRYSSGNLRVGLSAITYGYDRLIKRRIQDYNRLQIYDGLWGNAGIDALLSLGHWRLFGEAAIDAHASPAILAGAVWSPSYNLEMSVVGKAFSPSYIATHSIGDTYNRFGGEAAVRYVSGRWKLNFNAEYYYHPWYRYQKPAGGTTFKARATVQYSLKTDAFILLQASYNAKLKFRLHTSFPAGPLTASLRFDGNMQGYAAYAELSYRSGRFQAAARGTFYNTEGWDSRVCLYEKNVPESFNVETFYGKGLGAYLLLRYTPFKCLDLWLKARHDYSAFFIRIFFPG